MFRFPGILVAVVLAALTLSGAGSHAQVSFSSQTYALKNSPFQVVTGDFNGDGKPDVAVLSPTGGTASILLTNADGTLSPASDFPAITPQAGCCGPFNGIAVGDVNGDGKLDLVLADPANPAGASVNVLLGKGDGTFGPAIITALNFLLQADALIGVSDFNGDKKLDVAVYGYDGNALGPFALLGNGDGTFSPSGITSAGLESIAFVVADVNGDDKPDIVISTIDADGSVLVVFLGNGDGTFQSPSQISEQAPQTDAMVAGDFNRDGKIDLVSTSFQNQRCEFGFCQPMGPPGALAVLLGAGNGTFGGPGVLASGDFSLAAVGDFDGDGNSDIVVNGSSSTFSIYLGDGTGGFPEQVGISFGACCGSLTAADLNGDGLEDIVSAVASGVQVQLNTTPGFSLAASASGPPIPAGGSATYTINVGQQNGFSSAVSLTCSSPQLAGIACSVSPSSVTPGGKSTLTVTTTGASGALVRGLGYRWLYALWLPLGMVVFGIAERRIGKKNLCGLMLFCLTSLVACGGGSGSTRIPSTPSGSYTINVTGVSGSLQRSATVTLTVQ